MTTSFWFGGAENPSHHDIFTTFGVDQVAVNIGSMRRNYWKAFQGLDINTPNVDWIAWSDDATLPVDDLLDVIQRIGIPPKTVIGPIAWNAHKEYLPIWDGEGAMPLAEMHNGLTITDSAFMSKQARTRALSARSRNTILAVITGKSQQLDRFDVAINTSWYNYQQYGETHIWDGNSVRRYSADKKEASRLQNRESIEALGIDADEVLADDHEAVLAMTMRSWIQLAEHLARPTPIPVPLNSPVVSQPGGLAPSQASAASHAPAITLQRRRAVIPTMSSLVETIEDEEGLVLEEKRSIASVAETPRRCDNCAWNAACPSYDPGHSCAYSFPVLLKEKDQIIRALQVVLEVGLQRLFQLRFAEEIQGQDLDETWSKEADKVFKWTKLMKEYEVDDSGFKMFISSKGSAGPVAAGGALSRLFGDMGATPIGPPVIDINAEDAEVIEDHGTPSSYR